MSYDVRRRPAIRALAVVALAASVVLSGCVHEPPKPASESRTTRREDRATKPRRPPPPDRPGQLEDPCSTRLHDLSGLLLMYYALNKKLPERLDELAPLADVGAESGVDCPGSGLPYVYAPSGVPAPGSDRFLLLYDAVPAHGGLRWGVFIAPPRDKQPPATWVIPMSDEVYRTYVPRTQ